MATISSVFKIQDNATKTFNNVANAVDSVIDKADKLSSMSSELGSGTEKINPALSQAIDKYNQLNLQSERLARKSVLLQKEETMLVRQLEQQRNATNKNEKAILATEKKLFNVRNQLDRIEQQGTRITNEIYEQASAVTQVAKNAQNLKPALDQGEQGFSKMGARIVTINQGLQLAKSIAGGVGKVLNLSDELTLTKARIDLINDGTQSTVELQNKIYQAATRSRGAYDDMSKSIAKLGLLAGDAFKNNDEMVAFSEMLNKSFKVSGASNQEISSATYQLTQAMAAGKLQGDEFRSIMENAPMLADAIAKYMGKSKGELKELSSEGVITADIIKNALFSASDDINKKFDQMPKTFGDAMNNIKNTSQRYLQPIADKITEILNGPRFQAILQNVLATIRWFAGAAYKSFQLIGNGINFLKNNMWFTIPVVTLLATVIGINLVTSLSAAIPLIWAKVTAWLALHWQMLVIVGVVGLIVGVMISLGASLRQVITVLLILAATFIIVKLAIWLVNAALYACPLVWIVIAVVALIMAIVFLVSCILSFGDTTNTVLGYVCAIFMWAVALVWNLFLGLLDLVLGVVNAMVNPWISFANFFANVFNDPIGSIIHLFGDFADSILGIVESIAKALDKVFGSDLAGSVKKWRKGLDKMVEKAADKHGNGKYEKVAEELNLDSETLGLKRFEYGDAWNTGMKFGNNLQNGIADKVSGFVDKLKGLGGDMENMLGNPEDASKYGAYDMGKFIDGNGNIPVDVKKNSDKEVDISDEDLKMLKDIATREYMLNYKHITPNVNIEFGDVRETADVNAIRGELERMMEEELAELYVVEEA